MNGFGAMSEEASKAIRTAVKVGLRRGDSSRQAVVRIRLCESSAPQGASDLSRRMCRFQTEHSSRSDRKQRP